MSNLNELDIRIFTQKSEADKAINSLKGILQGIDLDGIVNQDEINELDKWVIEHKSLINRNPFKEFMTIIQETIENKLPTKETIEDLYWLCQKYESDNYFYNAVTTDLQTLEGLCHGILSDGVINDQEVLGLKDWLYQNEHLMTYFPYDELRSLVLTILSDGKIDNEERLILEAFINQFVNIRDNNIKQSIVSEISNVKISGLCTCEPDIIFQDKSFCITGVLKRGARIETQNKIKQLGGIPVDNVTKKTDYLIVGDNGNPAWAFACYGRKVEKALSFRKEGSNISLIHEFDFFDILDDNIN